MYQSIKIFFVKANQLIFENIFIWQYCSGIFGELTFTVNTWLMMNRFPKIK
jgi:hypothetical protein